MILYSSHDACMTFLPYFILSSMICLLDSMTHVSLVTAGYFYDTFAYEICFYGIYLYGIYIYGIYFYRALKFMSINCTVVRNT
jgi:hypothetical protein